MFLYAASDSVIGSSSSKEPTKFDVFKTKVSQTLRPIIVSLRKFSNSDSDDCLAVVNDESKSAHNESH